MFVKKMAVFPIHLKKNVQEGERGFILLGNGVEDWGGFSVGGLEWSGGECV